MVPVNVNSRRDLFRAGFKITLPYLTGILPFGLLYASIAVAAGWPSGLVVFFSIVVFAGSSQLVFVDLYSHLGSGLQAVLGSNIVNTRHLIYSAGVSREFSGFPLRWRVLLAYLLTDQLFAFVEANTARAAQIPFDRRPWFYFGSGFCTWVFWALSTLVGVFFGQFIPKAWNLDFAIPLMFMPLLLNVCRNRFAVCTALLAAGFAFFLRPLPYGLGILTSILLASGGGYLILRLKK